MSHADFKITYSNGNRDNSLPQHWDIARPGSDETVVTVWESEDTALKIVDVFKANAELVSK